MQWDVDEKACYCSLDPGMDKAAQGSQISRSSSSSCQCKGRFLLPPILHAFGCNNELNCVQVAVFDDSLIALAKEMIQVMYM